MNVSQKIKANQYGGPRKLKCVMRAGAPAEGGGMGGQGHQKSGDCLKRNSIHQPSAHCVCVCVC